MTDQQNDVEARQAARIMLRLQEGPGTAERMEREETIQWRNRLRDAKAVLAALRSPSREEVARIIEPKAFEKDASGLWRYRDARTVQAQALAKADTILALVTCRGV